MKYFSIILLVVISGCSSQSFSDGVADQVLESVTGKDFSRNAAQCPLIKSQCSDGNYEEWPLENGQTGCACN